MRKFVDIANLVMALLAGACLVLLTLFSMNGVRVLPAVLLDSTGLRIIAFLIGLGLVAANVYVLSEEIKAGDLRGNFSLSTEQGTTEFSVPSLEMLILRELKAEPDVVDPVVLLRPRGEGKPMFCKVGLKLRKQRDVLKRIDELKKKIRDAIDRLIPGGLTVEVLVEVRDFVSEPARNNRSSREMLPDPNEFNGPVYTDGGGSEGV